MPIATEKQTMKKVTKLGSKWNNSTNCSSFYLNFNNASSNRNRNISRQLVNARNTRPDVCGAGETDNLYSPESVPLGKT